jgi:hypothetical protein
MCPGRAINDESFCLDSARIERLMASDRHRVVEVNAPGRGTTDIQNVTLEVPDAKKKVRFRVKWKPAAEGGEGFNNHPRKELAAYLLQKLYLKPHEYVVPPTMIRCIPLGRMVEEHRVADPEPTFPGTSCVLGVMTYWMENVTSDRVFHPWKFERDVEYRKHVSDLNLLTYLIDHRDTHDGNFLISKDLSNPRAFSVDNGLAFSGLRNPIPLLENEPNWSNIIVPSLPRDKIEIFRGITRAELDRLGTVVQLRPDGGLLVPMERRAPFDPAEGVRVRAGVVQLGLTKGEIDGVEERIEELLEKVERREIALYE